MIPETAGHGTDPRTSAPASATAMLQALVQVLTAEVRAGVEHQVRAIVRDEMRRGSGTEAQYVPPGVAAAMLGCSGATLRRYVKRGLLRRYHRGRIAVAELHALMESGGPPPPSDLASERARRATARVKGEPSR